MLRDIQHLAGHPRGFTLAELMVVVAIMVILAGVLVPRYASTLTRSKVRDESNRLLAVVRYGQGVAAMQRVTYWLKINIEAATYSLERGAGRGDEFDAADDQLMAGGGASYAAPTPVASAEGGEEGEAARVAGTGRTRAGAVEVFDETQHKLARGVKVKKVVDCWGTEHDAGELSIPLDPRGSSQDTTVYLGLEAENSDIYSIHIGANGLTEVNVERARR